MIVFWAIVWVVSLIGMAAGAGFVEDPNNSLLLGVVVMYSFCGIMCYATIQMVRKDTWTRK